MTPPKSCISQKSLWHSEHCGMLWKPLWSNTVGSTAPCSQQVRKSCWKARKRRTGVQQSFCQLFSKVHPFIIQLGNVDALKFHLNTPTQTQKASSRAFFLAFMDSGLSGLGYTFL